MTSSTNNRDVGLTVSLLALGSLAIIGIALYAAFWVPFRAPKAPLPRSVEMLPLETPQAIAEPDDLDGYGWVDRESQIVHIPIAKAMELVTETLPVRGGAEEAAQRRESEVIPTDAGSGRFVTRGRPRE